MNRKQRQRVAEETVAILEAGRFEGPEGEVEIGPALAASVAGTRLYTPDEPPPAAAPSDARTRVELRNETTLEGARALVDAGHRVAALNFASGVNPGGGFLRGSQAQEESLARASGLYSTLVGSPYYQFHRAQDDAVYSDHVIYSPDVPVFRDDAGVMLASPWPCSFVTSPAIKRQKVTRAIDAEAIMRRRMSRVLDVMAANEHAAVVLGAWGCGVFRNEPEMIAGLFDEALRTTHRGVFEVARFSVFDPKGDGTLAAFAQRLDRAGG